MPPTESLEARTQHVHPCDLNILAVDVEIDEAREAAIARDMQTRGWRGRPLLVFEGFGGYLCLLTGNHRLDAALGVDLDRIPVVRVTPEACKRASDCAIAWLLAMGKSHDPEEGDWLLRLPDDLQERFIREGGDTVAADLLLEEIRVHAQRNNSN